MFGTENSLDIDSAIWDRILFKYVKLIQLYVMYANAMGYMQIIRIDSKHLAFNMILHLSD